MLARTCADDENVIILASWRQATVNPSATDRSMSDKSKHDKKSDAAVLEREKVKKPDMYKVLLHNDHYTTMEFVVEVLTTIFKKDRAEAVHLMLFVHQKGRAVAGIYTRDVAETKVEKTLTYAREQGHPLLVTMEKD